MSANPISLIRASKMARPMTCRGSLFFDVPESAPNEAAREGTACAEVLERLIKGMPPINVATNGVAINDDMRFYARVIHEDMLSRAVGPINSETRVGWETAGITLGGSYDASYVDAQGTLHVEDLKYGWKVVEPKENWQLLTYAIGEVMRRGVAFPKITLTIQQPRPHHEKGPVRSWTISYDELIAYKARIDEMATKVAAGDNELVTSEHCKYCNAGIVCPALSKAFFASFEYAQEFVVDHIDEKELAHQLELVDRAADIIKIRQDSLKSLAIDHIRQGKTLRNYVIENSLGDRVWKPGVSAETLSLMTGVDATETRLLSPAKIERMKGVNRKLVESLVERPSTGAKLKKKNVSEMGNEIFGAGAPKKEV